MTVSTSNVPAPAFAITKGATEDSTQERRPDFLEELAERARANHRLRWELANPHGTGSSGEAYVELTEVEVIRDVYRMLAAMEQQQVDSYWDAMEALDYEEYLASEFPDDEAASTLPSR